MGEPGNGGAVGRGDATGQEAGRPGILGERAARWEALPVLLLGAVVGYLAVSRLALRAGALSAPASALLHLPPAGFWIPVAAVTAPVGLVALWCALRRGSAVPVRLFYLLAAGVLFTQVFLLPAVRLPPTVTADFTMTSSLQVVATRLATLSQGGALPVDPAVARRAVEGLPPPPYRRAGAPLGRWHLVVRAGCSGPATRPGTLAVGTVVYCVAPDRHAGWLTLVGTGGRALGPPAMGRDGQGHLVVVPVRPSDVRDTLPARIDRPR